VVTIDFLTETNSQILQRANDTLNNDKLPEWERDIWTFIQSFLNPKIKNFSVFTSGSTGKPKLISHTREQLNASAKATIELFHLHEGDKALLALPVKHIGGRMMIVRSVLAKLKLTYVPVSSNPLSHITAKGKFDFAAFTPMQFANILNDVVTQKKTESISTVILGGGEISNSLHSKIEKLKLSVFHTYGMTETASHVAVKKLNGADASEKFNGLPGITFDVDARNCLIIHAPAFSKETFTTNDIVELESPTSFVWKGRFDNVINSGGIKIQAETIERKLHNFIAGRFFFTAEKDEILGERVVLVIEAGQYDEKQMQQLIKILDKHLDKYEYPKQLLFVYKFRETEAGKVLRAESLKLEAKRIVL